MSRCSSAGVFGGSGMPSVAPLDWATAQSNLGVALSMLGERESGTARLEEAVATYRAALEELTRDRCRSTGRRGVNSNEIFTGLALLAYRTGQLVCRSAGGEPFN
jgi:hypothetical protein